MSWVQELGELYNEAWSPGSPNLPGNARTALPPQETANSIGYKGVFGASDAPRNLAKMSMASGQNPYEQEEGEVIDKNFVLSHINELMSELDSSSQLDQSAYLQLGKLKKIIEKS